MPSNLAVGGVSGKSQTITYLTVGGDKPSTRINEIPAAATALQLTALREALGDLTNAAVLKDSVTSFVEKPSNDVEAFDEAYSGANIRLILKFQNNALNIREVGIPAPDAVFFGADGAVAITPDAGGTDAQVLLQTAITAALAVFNAGGDTYEYTAGFRSPLPAGVTVRSLPTIAEPGVGAEPPPEPGL